MRLATATQRLELRRRAEKDKEYWERMARVVGEKGHRIWKRLDKELLNYNLLLEVRANTLQVINMLQ